MQLRRGECPVPSDHTHDGRDGQSDERSHTWPVRHRPFMRIPHHISDIARGVGHSTSTKFNQVRPHRPGSSRCLLVNWLCGALGSSIRPVQCTPGLRTHVTLKSYLDISRLHRWHGSEHPSRPLESIRQVHMSAPALRRIHLATAWLFTPLRSASRLHAPISLRSAQHRCVLVTTGPLFVDAKTVFASLWALV